MKLPPVPPTSKKECSLPSTEASPQTPTLAHQPIELPILGMIPDVTHDELRAAGLAPLRRESGAIRRVFPKEVLFVHPPQMITAAYRDLTTQVSEALSVDSPRSVLFTSPSPGEGTTLTAVNTAISLAKLGARVLLIDANLHRAACHTMLAMPHHAGLGEFVSGQSELSELLQPTAIDRLVFLSAGSSLSVSAEALDSPSLQSTLPFLHKMYDYLVIDSPAIDSAPEVLLLAARIAGVVLVTDGQHTPSSQVQHTWQRLTQMHIPLLGVAINKADGRSRKYLQYHQPAALRNGTGEKGEETAEKRLDILGS